MRKKIENEVVLSAALRVFARYGYRKATLEDITSELNMTAAGIYAYAESKRELYEQTVSFAMLRWQDRVKNAVSKEESASAKFAVLCGSALCYLAEDRDFSALLENDPSIFPMFPTVYPYED
ncbi:MAG: helix-turn-helix domain-containing protein, partial [Oscillospiraceae bacterium]